MSGEFYGTETVTDVISGTNLSGKNTQTYNGQTNDQPDKVLTPSGGPAADLYKSKYGFSSSYGLIYPKDLYSSGRAHSVVFDIFEISPLGYGEDKNKKSTTLSDEEMAAAEYYGFGYGDVEQANFIAGLKKEIGNVGLTGVAATAAQAGIAALESGASKAVELAKKAGITVGETLFPGQLNINPRTKQNAVASIGLYMPETLNFSYDAHYNDTATLSGAIGSLTGTLGQGMSSFIDNAALKLAMNAAGYVFNPQQQVLFEGIEFRPYEMNFTFSPSSVEETRTVNEIIKTFRFHAAPEIGGLGGFFFTPPSIFNVSFKYAGKTNPNINLLKKSVLKQVNVNYAPNGWAAFEGNGAPVQITLALQFQEIVLVDKTEIKKGY